MQLLKARCSDETPFLLEYFDQAYVSDTNVQRRGRISQPDIPERFPSELRNAHQVTVNDCPGTNNVCEGWNNKFHHLVGY